MARLSLIAGVVTAVAVACGGSASPPSTSPSGAPADFVRLACTAVGDLAASAPAISALQTDAGTGDLSAIQLDIENLKRPISRSQVDLDQVPPWASGDPAIKSLSTSLEQLQGALNRVSAGVATDDVATIQVGTLAAADAFDQIQRGLGDLESLEAMYRFDCPAARLPTSALGPSRTPTPTRVSEADAPSVYAAVAERSNAAFQTLGLAQPGSRWIGTADQEAAATAGMLAIEDDVAARLAQIDWPSDVAGDGAALIASVDAVRARLRADPSGDQLGSISTSELVVQLEAAFDLRAKLGLPPRNVETDIL